MSDDVVKELRFGTSGLRDTVLNMTDMECYVNTMGFLEYLSKTGDFRKGMYAALGGDLRPSTPRIMRAVAMGIKDKGGKVDNQGFLPTPALVYYAMGKGIPGIMVTGSHIPKDRNGIKFTKKTGEILKEDENGILAAVAGERKKLIAIPGGQSLFDNKGMFKKENSIALDKLATGSVGGEKAINNYMERYVDIFKPLIPKSEKKIFLYEHSSVGRDAAKSIFKALGFDLITPSNLRSSDFVSIDTESVSNETIEIFKNVMTENDLDIGITMDGDADRPLLVYRKYINGKKSGEIDYITGDILGLLTILCLEKLGVRINHVSVPVSSNDAISLVLNDKKIEFNLTRIGSPYVIDSMIKSIEKHGAGKWNACSWESNGGFLTGTDLKIKGKVLKALPTRDACLPLLIVIVTSLLTKTSICEMVSSLAARFTYADRKKEFPPDTSKAIIEYLSPRKPGIKEISACDNSFEEIKRKVENAFTGNLGFSKVVKINYIDGVRIYFENGEISHLRPSGNAPEFRNYAIASSRERAREIVEIGLEKVVPELSLLALESKV